MFDFGTAGELACDDVEFIVDGGLLTTTAEPPAPTVDAVRCGAGGDFGGTSLLALKAEAEAEVGGGRAELARGTGGDFGDATAAAGDGVDGEAMTVGLTADCAPSLLPLDVDVAALVVVVIVVVVVAVGVVAVGANEVMEVGDVSTGTGGAV